MLLWGVCELTVHKTLYANIHLQPALSAHHLHRHHASTSSSANVMAAKLTCTGGGHRATTTTSCTGNEILCDPETASHTSSKLEHALHADLRDGQTSHNHKEL